MAREPQLQPASPPPIGLPLEPISATAGPPAAEAGGILTIDLGAIHANYRMLTSRVLPIECAAVVKGNAYGCGIDQVTTTLARAGCRTFFVAHLAEARRVRAIAPEAAIYVLNGFSSSAGPAFVEANAQQLANSIQRIAHPEGKRPQLSGRDFSSWNDHVQVKIAVSWIRGPGSRHYTTWVAWDFSEKSHLQARVVSDSASTKITAKDSALLDEHFREKIYPAIARAANAAMP